MSKTNNPVSVVISTRQIDDKYLDHVSKMFSHPKTQIIVYENQGEFSLPQLYNKGLDESTNDIVVFMHDDLIIETTNVTKKIVRLFETNPDHGIIGIAGTNNLLNGMWWTDRKSMYGQVKHEHEGKVHRNNYSGPYDEFLKNVVCVDGLFFAVHKGRIKERFDEEFPGFHFYDIPFCVSNFVKNVKIGVTTKIMVIHKSIGMVNKQWEKNKLFFEAKYGNLLPLTV
jgi:glycosyltransferase involved in cell wall biosynthesis